MGSLRGSFNGSFKGSLKGSFDDLLLHMLMVLDYEHYLETIVS